MFITSVILLFLIFVKQIDARTFHSRQSDSLTILRDKCAQNPSAAECTRIRAEMEDLLRKCGQMASPVSACKEVRDKYCVIWPRELYCLTSGGGGGGGGGSGPSPPSTSDPDWNQIPPSSNELRLRGEYCVTHQSEQKCRNLMNAIKVRYEQCTKLPKTDPGCQSFKVSLCAAFPKFSPCLNGGSGFKRQVSRLEHLLPIRRKV